MKKRINLHDKKDFSEFSNALKEFLSFYHFLGTEIPEFSYILERATKALFYWVFRHYRNMGNYGIWGVSGHCRLLDFYPINSLKNAKIRPLLDITYNTA